MASIVRTAFLIVAMGLALPATAFAQTDVCPRPDVGDPVKAPPDLYSANGVLQVALNYYTRLDKYKRTLFCFETADGKESPTLHVQPGDTLEIALTNMAGDSAAEIGSDLVANDKDHCGKLLTLGSVNMHFDGTNTSPRCHSDDIFMAVNRTFKYQVHIPKDEPPGLYWYHPHVIGLADPAVQGGASGAIIVEGIARLQPAVKGLPQRVLIVRDTPLAHPPRMNLGRPNVPYWDMSLNYVPIVYPRQTPSVITMHQGAEEFWRVVNASADTQADVRVLYDGVPQELQIVALDGVPTGSGDGRHKGTIITQTDVFIPVGGRAEFIVKGPSSGVKTAQLVTLGVDTGPDGDNDPGRTLANIKTTTDPNWLPPTIERMSPESGEAFPDLSDAHVIVHRHLYFSEVLLRGRQRDGNYGYYITIDGQQPELYNNWQPEVVTLKGAVEDWTIENRTREVHEFHINQIHYLLLAVNGKPIPKDQQQFYDTHQVDYWTGTGPYPKIKVRMDFRGPVVGEFVFHCHILHHADGGMIAKIVVKKKPVVGDN